MPRPRGVCWENEFQRSRRGGSGSGDQIPNFPGCASHFSAGLEGLAGARPCNLLWATAPHSSGVSRHTTLSSETNPTIKCGQPLLFK